MAEEQATLARPYAEAVFSLAKENNQLEEWSEFLAFLTTVMQAPEMLALFGNPNVSKQKLSAFIQDVCEGQHQLGELANNLIKTLADNQRLKVVPSLSAQFEASKAKDQGRLHVDLISAYAVRTAMQKNSIAKTLSERFGKEVELNIIIDRDLIGGWIVRAGDQVIDMSVKGRLNSLATKLRT
jgi:F-type H+-transporting ATPase subunit delta